MSEFILVKTTFPNITSAKKLVKILLQEKLIACAQFYEIKSSYIWEEKIQNNKEILLNLKSQKKLYKKIEKEILQNHPYKTPQIISLEINDGFQEYFSWVKEVTKI